MTGIKPAFGFAIGCLLLAFAAAAQPASAVTSGQTIFECSGSVTTKTFSDAHCDNTSGTLKFGHIPLPQGEKIPVWVSNAHTASETTGSTVAEAKIGTLHGFSNVTIQCKQIEGSVRAVNTLEGEVHEGTGTTVVGTGVLFRNGQGEPCTTNQAGCTVGVSEIQAQATTVEGLAPGMGLQFKPLGAATKFGTVKFEGTCGLAVFPPMAIEGSTIATAHGEPTGGGATAYFVEGGMNSLTIAGAATQFIAKLTFKRESTENSLVLTTAPFVKDA